MSGALAQQWAALREQVRGNPRLRLALVLVVALLLAMVWQGLESLQFRLFWSENTPATWAFRVDDRPGNPAYAERFQ